MLVALRPPVRFPPPGESTEAFSFLERLFSPRTVFMEIGAADCRLALRTAGYVERVYAIDVSGEFLRNVLVPCNLRLVLCDGVHIPVPEASVDVAWSGAFMDQLHPDDAATHLRNVCRSLAPGGQYLFRTPLPARLRAPLLEAGFASLKCYAGGIRTPLSLAAFTPGARFAALKGRDAKH